MRNNSVQRSIQPLKGRGVINKPMAVAVTEDDRIIVLDSNHNALMYGPDGEFLFRFERKRGALAAARTLAAPSPKVTMSLSKRGIRVTAGVGVLPGNDITGGVAVAPNGNIVITDAELHRIQLFSAEGGKLLETFGGEGQGAGKLRRPTGVAVSRDNEIFVSDTENGRVQVFNGEDGSFVRVFGEEELVKPIGLVAGPDGIFVADAIQHAIKYFSFTGEEQYAPITRPIVHNCCGLALEPVPPGFKHGCVFVTAVGGTVVEVYDRRGELVNILGGEMGERAGQLSDAIDVAISSDGDVMAVADRQNQRVQVFSNKKKGWEKPIETLPEDEAEVVAMAQIADALVYRSSGEGSGALHTVRESGSAGTGVTFTPVSGSAARQAVKGAAMRVESLADLPIDRQSTSPELLAPVSGGTKTFGVASSNARSPARSLRSLDGAATEELLKDAASALGEVDGRIGDSSKTSEAADDVVADAEAELRGSV